MIDIRVSCSRQLFTISRFHQPFALAVHFTLAICILQLTTDVICRGSVCLGGVPNVFVVCVRFMIDTVLYTLTLGKCIHPFPQQFVRRESWKKRHFYNFNLAPNPQSPSTILQFQTCNLINWFDSGFRYLFFFPFWITQQYFKI